jgi:surface antigen
MILVGVLASCQPPTIAEQSPDPVAPELEDLLGRAWAGDDASVPESVALRVVRELGVDVGAVVRLDDEHDLYLAGEPEDLERFVAGQRAARPLSGVLVSRHLRGAPCLGTVEVQDPSDVDESRAAACAQVPDWPEVLDAELVAQTEPLVAPFPLPTSACTAVCGADDGLKYAGAEAFSNGVQTGTGNACNGTDTWGYRYQCVQFTEKVHARSDWSGNAYTGYWTSTSAGPWQKGLLPLANGTSITAPKPGDIVVWSAGTYGHVGILAIVGSTSATVYDQNRSCGSQSCTLTYTAGSKYTLGAGTCLSVAPVGFLRRGWDFSGAFGLSGGWTTNDMAYKSGTVSGSNGDPSDYITFDPGATDPYLVSPTGIAVQAGSTGIAYNKLVVVMKSACTNKAAKVYWKRTSDSGFSETRVVSATLSGSDWNTVTFNLGASANYTGTIDRIRLDPATACSTGSTDLVSLRYAYFTR